jgi:hypothetical protein
MFEPYAYKLLITIDYFYGGIFAGCIIATVLLLLPVPPVPDLLDESLGLEILLFLEL